MFAKFGQNWSRSSGKEHENVKKIFRQTGRWTGNSKSEKKSHFSYQLK